MQSIKTSRAASSNRKSSPARSNHTQRAIALAAFAAIGTVGSVTARHARATAYVLSGNDTSTGISSFYSTLQGGAKGWVIGTNNIGTSGVAPTANGNTYEVTAGNSTDYLLRTLGDANSVAFGQADGNTTLGNSTLQLDAGGRFLIKNTSAVTISANLILAGGTMEQTTSGTIVAGTISLMSSVCNNAGVGNNSASVSTGNFTQNFSTIAANLGSTFNINAVISGSGNLSVGDAGGLYFGDTGTSGSDQGGTVLLNASNTYSGTTNILNSGVVLQLGNASAAQDSIITINAANTLKFSTGIGTFTVGGLSGTGNESLGNATLPTVTLVVGGGNNTGMSYSGILSGAGGLTMTGNGTQTLTGANSYLGATTLSGGTLQLGNATAVGNSTVTISSGNLAFSTGIGNFTIGGLAGSGNLTLADISPAAVTLLVGNNNSFTSYSGALSGAGGLTKIGTGLLTLSGASSYSGATAINAGGILVSGTLSNTNVTVGTGSAAAYLTATGNGVSTGNITGSVTVNGNGSIDFSKDLATGTAQVLAVGNLSLATGTSAANSSSLTFNLTGPNTSDTIAVGGNLTVGGSGSAMVNFGGTLASGNYTLLTYAAQSGQAPSGNASNGVFVFGSTPGGLFTDSLNDTSTALILQITANPTPPSAYWYGAFSGNTSATWGANNGNSSSPLTNWSGNATGVGDANQVPGSTTDVVFTASNVSGSVSTILDTNYAINSLTVNATPASVTIGGNGTNLTIDAAASVVAGGQGYSAGTGINILSGAGPVTINTTGTVFAAANQSWTNGSSNLFSVTGPIAGTAAANNLTTLTLSNTATGNTTLGGNISDGSNGGKLALVVNDTGSGITTLSGNSTYSGGTILSSGTVSIASNSNLGAVSGNLTLNGGTLRITSTTPALQPSTSVTPSLNRAVVLGASGGTINVATAATGTFSSQESAVIYQGSITGTSGGGLTVTGNSSGTNSGTNPYLLELGGLSTYNGNTTINNATVATETNGSSSLTLTNVLPSTTVLTLQNNGWLVLDSGDSKQTVAGLIGDATAVITTTNNSGLAILTITPAAGQTYTYGGVIGNTTFLNKTGAATNESVVINGTGNGTEVFTGANSYPGGTTISSGVLQLGNGTTTGTLATTGTIVDNGLLVFNRSNTVTQGTDFSTAGISGTGGITQAGTGILILNAAETYSGTTTINPSGTVQIGNATATGSLATTGTIADNGSLVFSLSGNIAQGTAFSASAITGNGSLTQAGTGQLTLNLNNTYSGPTNVSSGTLVLNHAGNNTGGLAGGVNVSSAATFLVMGNTTIGGNLSSSGTVSTADGSINTFTVPGTLTLSGSTIDEEINGSTITSDLINVTGNTTPASISGTNTINITGSPATGNYTLIADPAGGLGTGNFTLGSGGSGFAALSLSNSTSTNEILTVAVTAPQSVAYWTGNASQQNSDTANNWGNGSSSTASNWSGNVSGTPDALTVPGSITDVYFTAQNATPAGNGTLTTQLDGSYSIRGLFFDTSVATATISSVNINTNGNPLSIGSDGLTVNSTDTSTTTIGGNGSVIVNGSQNWANNATTPELLTVSAPIAAASGATTLTLNGNGTGGVNLSGTISDGGGTLALVDNQVGITTLSGVNSYSGGTTINAGTLSISSDANLGKVPTTAGTNITINGGTLQVTAGTQISAANQTINTNRGITLGSNGGTMNVGFTDGSGNSTFQSETSLNYYGLINGSGGLTVIGSGGNVGNASQSIVELLTPATYGGNTTINNAVVQVKSNNAAVQNILPTTTVLNLVNNGLFNMDATNSSISIVGLNGDSSAAIGSTNQSATNTTTVTVTGNGSYAYAGTIGGVTVAGRTGTGLGTALNISLTGGGSQTLTNGTSNFGAGTTVTTGNLFVNNSAGASGLGTGNITVNGGMLAGNSNGLGAGNVTVNSGGSISAGPDGLHAGTLNTASQTWNSGGTYVWKMNDLPVGGNGTAGTNWDLINMANWTVPTGNASFTVAMQSYGGSTPAAFNAVNNFGSSNTFEIASLTSTNLSGVVAGGDSVIPLTSASTGNGTVGTANFTLNTANFTNDTTASTDGSAYLEFIGSGAGTGGTLDVVYAATPEPGSMVLMVGGVLPLLAARRRRRPKSIAN